jgi:tripartite-type tricarboxylate transporter receptor subunit TctC
MMSRSLVAIVVASALGLHLAGASAQPYPNKPIRIIVPFPPGGATDVLARTVGPRMAESFGQQVVVENRSGATGNIGAELAAKAPPDGYTIVVGQASNIAINITLMGKLPYDPIKDFTPLTLLASTPNVLVIHPSLPVRGVKDLIALAKSKPGALNYATSGNGSPGHFSAELLKKMAGIDMVHIPYKGASPALIDVVGGHASLYFTAMLSAQPFVKSGRLRVIAQTSVKRSPSLPDLPTIAEAGYPDYDITSWWGMLGPAGLPRDITNKLHAEIVRIIALPDVKERLNGLGADAATNTPEQFAAYIKAEIAKWARIIRETGVKAE